MLKVGLTGGIGCGKSIVCHYFQELGATVIDTDIIARELVEPQMPACQLIGKQFGQQVLNKDGSINRSLLREVIFSDEDKRKQLESILHPLIRDELNRQIGQLHAPYVIIAIPLLVEKGWQQLLDRVLVVDCRVDLQRERALQRDGGEAETIDRIIASQATREERLKAADDVIENNSSLQALHAQVTQLHEQYLQLSASN